MKSTYQSKWDAIGISASLLCAVHCVIFPFFISTLPFLGIELLKNKALESAMILISLLAGSWALYTGYRKRRRRIWPLPLFALGMIFLLSAALWIRPEGTEMVFKALAAVCIITAHLFNRKYSRACDVHVH